MVWENDSQPVFGLSFPPSIIFIQLTLLRLASVRASRLEGDHLKEAPPHALHIPSPAVVGFTQRF